MCSPAGSDLRIVLLGKTGVGKSASGNTILGNEEFLEESSPESVTRKCKKYETKVSGRKVEVVDTPGLFDTSLTIAELKDEIVKCVYMTVPGPHVFLLVIRLGVRFTEEERNTMKWIQENFSKLALKYAMVLFTGGDSISIEVEDYIEKSQALKQLISECEGRFHVFDNTKRDRAQVTRLLTKIDKMVAANGGQHYTDQMYLEAQRKIKEEEERKRKEEERKQQEEERKRQEEQRKREEAMRKEWEKAEKQRREEDKKRFEEEKRERLEEERQRREADKKEYEGKQEEQRKLFAEVERKRCEEERKRREEERKDWERAEKQRREEDRKRFEEEKRQRLEEERQRREADKKEYERKQEEQRKLFAEQERKRCEEERQRREEEKKKLERAEGQRREEERQRREADKKEYERKQEEQRKWFEEQERKRCEEERQRRVEERKEWERRQEEERKRYEKQERKRREEERQREQEREKERRREEERKKNDNPLAFFGKVALAVPAFVGGAAVGAVKAVVDVPVGIVKGGMESLEGRDKPKPLEVPGAFLDVVAGELKGGVLEVAKAPGKVIDGGIDFVKALWK